MYLAYPAVRGVRKNGQKRVVGLANAKAPADKPAGGTVLGGFASGKQAILLAVKNNNRIFGGSLTFRFSFSNTGVFFLE